MNKKKNQPKISLEKFTDLLNPIHQMLLNIDEKIINNHLRKFNVQTYIGEAVLDELLKQSYNSSNYSTEEKLKRLIAAVEKAFESFNKDLEQDRHSTLTENIILWGKNPEVHSIHIGEPESSKINLKKN